MNFDEKLDIAKNELRNTGIWKSNYTPPLLQLFQKLGIKVKPPHYAKFISNFLSLGIYFGIVWGVLMWFIVWRNTEMPIIIAILSSIVAGLLFGLIMSYYYRYAASKHDLTKWEDLGENGA